MNDPALQNLDYLRQLIAAVRGDLPIADALRLRMIYDTGTGTDMVAEENLE